jgi:four helix bundle protein
MERKYDLNERLIDFAVSIIELYNEVTKSPAGIYLSDHLMRAGISPSLHYGEAQGAESRKEFIHKLGILIKELREALNAMKVIRKAKLIKSNEKCDSVIKECAELISIFNKSITTARKNSEGK